jgi:hypothetical protein
VTPATKAQETGSWVVPHGRAVHRMVELREDAQVAADVAGDGRGDQRQALVIDVLCGPS